MRSFAATTRVLAASRRALALDFVGLALIVIYLLVRSYKRKPKAA